MIELNLLPYKEKINSSLLWKYVMAKTIIVIILTLSFVISAVLFGAKLILLKQFAVVQEQSKVVNITHQKINERVNAYNRQIRLLNDIQNEYYIWPETLFNVNQAISQGIHLQRLTINLSEKSLTFEGIANTREDLLNFKTSLEKCNLVSEINIPLNTLLKKQNIDFNINGIINEPNCHD